MENRGVAVEKNEPPTRPAESRDPALAGGIEVRDKPPLEFAMSDSGSFFAPWSRPGTTWCIAETYFVGWWWDARSQRWAPVYAPPWMQILMRF